MIDIIYLIIYVFYYFIFDIFKFYKNGGVLTPPKLARQIIIYTKSNKILIFTQFLIST